MALCAFFFLHKEDSWNSFNHRSRKENRILHAYSPLGFFLLFFQTEETFIGSEAGEKFPLTSLFSKTPAVLQASFYVRMLEEKQGKRETQIEMCEEGNDKMFSGTVQRWPILFIMHSFLHFRHL